MDASDFISELLHDDLFAVGQNHYLLARQGELAVIAHSEPTKVLHFIHVGKPNVPMKLRIGGLESIVAVSTGSTIKLLNYVENVELYTDTCGSPITAIEWNHVTKSVFCYGTQGRRIYFVDARGNSKVSRPNCWTSCLCYSSTENTLATGSASGAVRVMETMTNYRVLVSISAHNNARINSLAWSPNNPNELLSCSDSQHEPVKLWSTVGDGSQEPRLIGTPAIQAAYLPAGRVIITAANLAEDGMADLQMWPLETPDTPIRTIRAHPSFGWLRSANSPNTLVIRTAAGIKKISLDQDEAIAAHLDSAFDDDVDGERVPGWRDDLEDNLPKAKTFVQEVRSLRKHPMPHVNYLNSNMTDLCEANIVFSRASNVQIVASLRLRAISNTQASFEFMEATTLDRATKAKLLQALQETYRTLKKGTPSAAWVIPCLRAAVDHLQRLASKAHVQDEDKERLLRGQRVIGVAQLKRPCGARFMSNGNLVIFTNSALAETKAAATSGHVIASESPGKATRPRGASLALRNDETGRSGSMPSKRILFGYGTRKKASSVVEAPAAVAYQRKHLANHVEVFETRAVLQLSKQQQVTMMGIFNSAHDNSCKATTDLMLQRQQYDLAQYWKVMGLALDLAHTMPGEQWKRHPCGGGYVLRVLQDFAKQRNVQSLTWLCLVLTRYTLLPSNPISLIPQEIRKPTDWSQPKKVVISPPLQNLLEALMLTDMTLKPQLCAFATILLTWGFPVDAAVVFRAAGHSNELTPPGGVQPPAALPAPCSICRVPAALFTPCPRCRHGGHFNHLQLWFQDCETCPVPNCNCRCPDETYMLPDTLGIDVP